MTTRRQATLYLPEPHAAAVEQLRSTHNPAQHALIRAHVTLCREDEVHDWTELASRLKTIGPIAISLVFGSPVRDGNLVYLPVTSLTSSFDRLRTSLLARSGTSVRKHEPHITLIHPRNGSCSDATFAQIMSHSIPFEATFRAVTLISQEGGGPWRDLLSA
jgi:hypothetical protein